MASGTGMAGLVVTAVVSALVAFGVAALVGPSAPSPPAGAAGPGESVEGLRREVDRLRAELQEVRAGRAASSAGGRSPAGPRESAGGSASAPEGGSGPAPATRDELRTFVDERLAERLGAGLGTGADPGAAPPLARKTLDEAGAELGLSSVDVDSVKRIWRESEMEAVALLMGTPDLEQVREDVRAAKEDPDRKAALINRVVGNMVRNLGRVATIKDRRNRELKRFLTEDQIGRLNGMNIRPFEEEEGMEEIFRGTFGD